MSEYPDEWQLAKHVKFTIWLQQLEATLFRIPYKAHNGGRLWKSLLLP